MDFKKYRLKDELADSEQLPRELVTTGKSVDRRPRTRRRFIRGPIEWRWLCSTGPVPGRALAVFCTLLLARSLTGSDTVKLSYRRLGEMGVNRHTGLRAIKALDRAGLVTAVLRSGRSPVVTLHLGGVPEVNVPGEGSPRTDQTPGSGRLSGPEEDPELISEPADDDSLTTPVAAAGHHAE